MNDWPSRITLLGQSWNATVPALLLTLYFLGGLAAYAVRCLAAGPYRDREIEARGSSMLLGNLARNYFAWVMRPLWALPLQQFVYRQLMYLVIIESAISALVGIRARWHTIPRTGDVEVRASTPAS